MAEKMELDSLFSSGGLDNKVDFLNDRASKNADGIYRVSMDLVKDKKKGWRSVVRLLPNINQEGVLGQVAIEKITHYVDIKNNKELSGWFDSAKNFPDGKCALTDLYYTMINSKNAILMEKAKCLKYSKKYYSYCLVIEDEQQPELVGKIMILQYGKQIREKIVAEKNGDISGEKCNVFDLSTGKDLTLIVKETGGEDSFPDYNSSAFKPNSTSLPIYNEEKKVFKNVPVIDVDGRLTIDPKFRGPVKDFLLKREHELETFAPKHLTETQQAKITEISNYLTGKSSNSFANANATSNDFDFEEPTTDKPKGRAVVEDSDDFFADFS